MTTFLEYIAYFIPPGFVALSEMYRVKFNRLKHSGKIPDIIVARQRHITFMVMAILSVVLMIMVIFTRF